MVFLPPLASSVTLISIAACLPLKISVLNFSSQLSVFLYLLAANVQGCLKISCRVASNISCSSCRLCRFAAQFLPKSNVQRLVDSCGSFLSHFFLTQLRSMRQITPPRFPCLSPCILSTLLSSRHLLHRTLSRHCSPQSLPHRYNRFICRLLISHIVSPSSSLLFSLLYPIFFPNPIFLPGTPALYGFSPARSVLRSTF